MKSGIAHSSHRQYTVGSKAEALITACFCCPHLECELTTVTRRETRRQFHAVGGPHAGPLPFGVGVQIWSCGLNVVHLSTGGRVSLICRAFGNVRGARLVLG